MRSTVSFFCCGLGRTDLKLAIDRDRIAVNDLAVKVFGERNRQCSLAAAGGPENRNQKWIAVQSASAPIDVVPRTGNRNGDDEDDDQDQAERFHGLNGTLRS